MKRMDIGYVRVSKSEQNPEPDGTPRERKQG
jgi:DNA invertase Pin-like site-specific DNA recombinase